MKLWLLQFGLIFAGILFGVAFEQLCLIRKLRLCHVGGCDFRMCGKKYVLIEVND